jgi:integrase
MPKPRKSKLETPTARRTLAQRRRPYWLKISPNISLGYRRNAGGGSWSVRVTGPGIDWIKRVGLADDLEPADGRDVLTYWQAIDAARKLARRRPGDDAEDDARPLTVAEAIEAYAADLITKSGDTYNACRARIHLPAAILSKPVALLSARELIRWRDGLIAQGLTPASVNRIRTCVRAALTLAAKRDRRITNRAAWEGELDALPNATVARNVVLPDEALARLIGAAYVHDPAFGLFAQVIAETGTRPSQAARLNVADLDARAARLLMPRSGKGHAHKRVLKMAERVPVPISPALVARLREAAHGRRPHDRLLARAGGTPWGYRRHDHYREAIRAVVTAAGLDPDEVTLYALRHTAISRALLKGVPVTVVADMTDTSEREIRKHYAKLIAHHADEIARRALPDLATPATVKIVPLRG